MASDVSMVVGKGGCCIAIISFLDAAIIQIVLFFPQTRVKLPSHTEVRILHLILVLLHLFLFSCLSSPWKSPTCRFFFPVVIWILCLFVSLVLLSYQNLLLGTGCSFKTSCLLVSVSNQNPSNCSIFSFWNLLLSLLAWLSACEWVEGGHRGGGGWVWRAVEDIQTIGAEREGWRCKTKYVGKWLSRWGRNCCKQVRLFKRDGDSLCCYIKCLYLGHQLKRLPKSLVHGWEKKG